MGRMNQPKRRPAPPSCPGTQVAKAPLRLELEWVGGFVEKVCAEFALEIVEECCSGLVTKELARNCCCARAPTMAALLLGIPPVPMARAPCPRRQLLSYIGHVGGGGAMGADVFARPQDDSMAMWCRVGRLAAGTASGADDDTASLAQAAQRQYRLISEHACRLHPGLRVAKRSNGIELGIASKLAGPVDAVLRPADGDATSRDMLQCGFVGQSSGRGIYHSFEEDGGATDYDREAERRRIHQLTGSSEIVMLAWPQCGFATKARALLEERGEVFADITIPKLSPIHAELALTFGRASVPAIFLDGAPSRILSSPPFTCLRHLYRRTSQSSVPCAASGKFVGGCDEDEEFPGLQRALTMRDAQARVGASGRRHAPNVRMTAATSEPEPLCDNCPSRCDGCPWAWMDADFVAAGGDEEALRRRDATAKAALGMLPAAAETSEWVTAQ